MTIDQTKTALLILDLQNEMVSPNGKVGAGALSAAVAERRVLENAAKMLTAARKHGMAIAFVRVGFRPDYLDSLSKAPRVAKMRTNQAVIVGTWGTEFPEIIAPKPGELIVTKQCVNPFFNTGLMTWLWNKGAQDLVVGGVSTNMVVEMTARAGDDAGFRMTVLEDCCAAPNSDVHRYAIENSIPLFGTVSTSDKCIAELG